MSTKYEIETVDLTQPHFKKEDLLQAMMYRYATKKFDPDKKIPAEDFQAILDGPSAGVFRQALTPAISSLFWHAKKPIWFTAPLTWSISSTTSKNCLKPHICFTRTHTQILPLMISKISNRSAPPSTGPANRLTSFSATC